MLSPNYIAKATDRAEAIAEQMHNAVIKRVVSNIITRLGRGDDYILTPSDKYRIDALQDSGELLKDIRADIVKMTPLLDDEVKQAFEDAGIKATRYDDKIYEKANIDHGDFRQSPRALRALQRNFEATEGSLDNYTKTTALEAQTAYVTEMNKAMTLVQSGAMGLNEAVNQAIEDISKTGITSIHYASGRTDTLEVAVARAVRTGISQATAQMQLERMKEVGCDLVITSSHLGARPTHEEWQGGIYHVDWKTLDITAQHKSDEAVATPETTDKRYPDFVQSTRYGYVDGLCGANCRHHFSPYFEGMKNPFPNYNSEENQAKYDAEQKQRAMERRIRQTKREKMAFKTAMDECKDDSLKPTLESTYRAKSKRLSEQRKAYKDYCEANNLKEQHERIKTLTQSRQKPEKVCDLPKNIYGNNPNIKNFKATISEKTIEHVIEQHMESYTKYRGLLNEIIQDPDYLLEDLKSDTAVVVLKEFDTNDHVRLVMETGDEPTIKTWFYINKRTWKKYIKNQNILYKKG